jgi:hypothetical protein
VVDESTANRDVAAPIGLLAPVDEVDGERGFKGSEAGDSSVMLLLLVRSFTGVEGEEEDAIAIQFTPIT